MYEHCTVVVFAKSNVNFNVLISLRLGRNLSNASDIIRNAQIHLIFIRINHRLDFNLAEIVGYCLFDCVRLVGAEEVEGHWCVHTR